MTVHPPLAVDWHALLLELRSTHGMTKRDIAMAAGLHFDTIRVYTNRAARPNHAFGEALIALWMRTTAKTRDQLPMEQMPISAHRAR